MIFCLNLLRKCFTNFDSLIVFESEFQMNESFAGAICSNSIIGKRFLVISQVKIITVSCWVICMYIRTFNEIFFKKHYVDHLWNVSYNTPSSKGYMLATFDKLFLANGPV